MRCYYCGCNLVTVKVPEGKPQPAALLTKDHATPKVRGGKNTPANYITSCFACNQDKGRLTLEEYRLVQATRRGLVSIGQDVLKFYGEFQQV